MATDILNVDCCIDKNNKVSLKLTVDASITVNGQFDGAMFTINNIDASSIFNDCSTATLNVVGKSINNASQLEITVTGNGDCDYPGSGPSVYSGTIYGKFTVPLVNADDNC